MIALPPPREVKLFESPVVWLDAVSENLPDTEGLEPRIPVNVTPLIDALVLDPKLYAQTTEELDSVTLLSPVHGCLENPWASTPCTAMAKERAMRATDFI